jgi:hypothetical protein
VEKERVVEAAINKSTRENLLLAQTALVNSQQGGKYKEGGWGTIFALVKVRGDGRVNDFLTAVFGEGRAPHRSQLLELMLVAAGVMPERSPDFNELPPF